MAETNVVGPIKGIYYSEESAGLPTVGSSMSWGTTATEVQTITISGTPTGGTLKLTYQGRAGVATSEETTALTYDDVFGDVDSALEALTSIGAGDVVVSGGAWPGAAMTVTFATLLVSHSIYPIKPTTIALTGGTNVGVTVARTTKGSPGWTKIESVTEAGVELNFINEGVDREESGRNMPVETFDTKMGLQAIKFQTAYSTEAFMDLAMPDGDITGATMYGGADRAYIALAVHTDNCVWYAGRCSAVGVPALSYVNSDFTKTPLEFKVYESPYEAKGTSNWVRHPIT
jgi:hypothetical protein